MSEPNEKQATIGSDNTQTLYNALARIDQLEAENAQLRAELEAK